MNKVNLKPREGHQTYAPFNFGLDLLEFKHDRKDLINTMGQLDDKQSYTFIFDMETNGLLDECTEIHCIALTTPNGDTSLFAKKDLPMALHHLANAECLIGHNILGFDIPVIKKLYPKWRTKARLRDTLVMSRIAYPEMALTDHIQDKIPQKFRGRHSLKSWGYRLDALKGEFSNEKTDWTTYTTEMADYCVQDTIVTLHLAHRLEALGLSKRSIELEQDFFLCLEDMQRNGVEFDEQACVALYQKLTEERDILLPKIAEAFPAKRIEMKTVQYYETPSGTMYRTKSDAPAKDRATLINGPLKFKTIPFNPNSGPQVVEALKARYNWEPKEFTEPSKAHPKGQPKVGEDIMEALPYPEAKLIARYQMLARRISQCYEGDTGWMKVARDGRIYGKINHNAAVTTRCTHNSPNLTAVPAIDKEFGEECRACFTVRPGYKMVGADMSGLELRCLAHYLHDMDGGVYTREILSDKGDIHTLNMWAAGLDTRAQAKKFIYAFLYGGGDELIGDIVGGGAAAGKKIKGSFTASIDGLAELMSNVKALSKKDGCIRAIDKRLIPAKEGYLALNRLLQSTGSILMKQATVFLMEMIAEKRVDAKLVLHAHDEYQLEVREDQAELAGQLAVLAMQRSGKSFGMNCPIDGEYKVGNNWAETH